MSQTNTIQHFDGLKAEITVFVEPCKSIMVDSKETCLNAVEAAKQVKQFIKKIDERRKFLVDPMNQQVKAINNYAKGLLEPLEEVEAHIKKQLAQWEQQMEKLRLEAQLKAEQERQKAEREAMAKAQATVEEAETVAMFMSEGEAQKVQQQAYATAEVGLMEVDFQHRTKLAEINELKVKGARKVWTFEVTDSNQIPKAFLMVNESMIRQAIRDGVRDIPGVRIYQQTSIAVGGL